LVTDGRVAAVRHETRCFVTSLSAVAVSPERLLPLIRGHWCIMNGLHFLKDRWQDEDRQGSTRPGSAEHLAMLRDVAPKALHLVPGVPDELPIRARADHWGLKIRKALKLIGSLTSQPCSPPAGQQGALAQDRTLMR
jgi:hypothetical protein